MKPNIWRVIFVIVFMLYLAIIDYFFDGWMKYVLIGLTLGIFPFNNKKEPENQKS